MFPCGGVAAQDSDGAVLIGEDGELWRDGVVDGSTCGDSLFGYLGRDLDFDVEPLMRRPVILDATREDGVVALPLLFGGLAPGWIVVPISLGGVSLGGHPAVRSASVGESRAARMAG